MSGEPASAPGRLRLAIFDCDGTLVDSQHAIVSAMASAWRSCGLPEPEPHAVRRIVGLSVLDAVARLLPEGPPDLHLTLAERYKTAFRDSRLRGELEEPLFPGIAAAIEDLDAEGVLLGIATGKSRRGLLSTLERHGLRSRFVTLQTADDCAGKPDPDMVLRAMSETGAGAGDTVVIGDTTYDMGMARSAAVGAVGVAWGYHEPEELAAAGAQAICRTCGEVPGAVRRLLQPMGTRT
ncbi:HAD-IA family hydrolase [Arenibaculum sp.]|uniref:HAD-IA family hydrolase n=1 Tax=Arenibaculum sp. TaxID=2865862 RepID=UPI002E133E68|nr:HAD-IA family hydrolase [Arenibaculum sp.]